MGKSRMEEIALLPIEEQQKILSLVKSKELQWDWRSWGRPEQISPKGDWSIWVYIAGSCAGKTRSAADWIR